MLAVGLAMFALRYLIPADKWPERLAKLCFWSLNIGLAWMVFAALLPLGIRQLYASVQQGYFEARSLNYLTSTGNRLLEWGRMPGDLIFIVGGCLPFLYIAFLGLRNARNRSTTLETAAGLAVHRTATRRRRRDPARVMFSVEVVLVCGYSGFLLAVAYGFDRLARRVAVRAQRWRTGSFRYHADHDAWTCPEDQWLWPASFDPDQRDRPLSSQAERVQLLPGQEHLHHLGRRAGRSPESSIPGRTPKPAGSTAASPAASRSWRWASRSACSCPGRPPPRPRCWSVSPPWSRWPAVPLARHLWRTPSNFPEHIPQTAIYELRRDRFGTRWGSFRRHRHRRTDRAEELTEPKN